VAELYPPVLSYSISKSNDRRKEYGMKYTKLNRTAEACMCQKRRKSQPKSIYSRKGKYNEITPTKLISLPPLNYSQA
jgi:hypothetical protein